jgi:hypothetical protein
MVSIKPGPASLLLVVLAVAAAIANLCLLANATTLATSNSRKILQEQCNRTYIGEFEDDDGNGNVGLCGECATRNVGTPL